MKAFAWSLLALMTALPVCAKPKISVHVKVHEGMGRDQATDSLTKSGASNVSNVTYNTIFYLNASIASDNPAVAARYNGQWCISGGSALDVNGEYDGTLDGNNLEVGVAGKNGKIKKQQFQVIDHKWRKLSDFEQYPR
jgi:hypothetical protein